MNDYIYNIYKEAKENNDIKLMKELYENQPDNGILKFSYAKMLLENNNKELGKKLLLELTHTKSKKYAVTQLNKSKTRKKTTKK